MSKILKRYLKEQNAPPEGQDAVRAAAAQSGVDFDKLPPDIQNKLGDLITSWNQNQQSYQQLSDREASIATQIDALTNQPDTPDKQNLLTQLNNQLASTRSGLDQIKSSNAEIETMGKEIEPIVTQLRDTGQAAAAPPETPASPEVVAPEAGSTLGRVGQRVYDQAKEVGSQFNQDVIQPAGQAISQKVPEIAAAGKEMIGTAKDYWEPKVPEIAAAGKEMIGTAKDYWEPKVQGATDWVTKQVTAPPPEGTMPPDMPQAPPPEMHQGTLQNIPRASVSAHGGEYQPTVSPPPVAAQPPTPEPAVQATPPPAQPIADAPPTQQPPPQDTSGGGDMGDIGAGAAAAGLAGAAVLGAYKLYKQFFSKAARACANAPSKDECMQAYRDQGIQAASNNLKRQLPKCGNDQNCTQKLQMAIKRLESKLGE